MNKVDREDHLFAAFSYFDKDGSGYITLDELQQACKEFGVDEVHLEEIIKEADQNNVRFSRSICVFESISSQNIDRFLCEKGVLNLFGLLLACRMDV